jgi:hypothetical protein
MNPRPALSLLIGMLVSTIPSTPNLAAAQDPGAASIPAETTTTTSAMSPNEIPAGLPTWTSSFGYNGKHYRFTMVGANPKTNTSTTITANLIPIKVMCQGVLLDPDHILSNGQTVVQNTATSPIFNSGYHFIEGNTQYIDAFQRGNFWNVVQTHTNYHLLLNLQVKQPQLVTPASCTLETFEGVMVGNVVNTDNAFLKQIVPYIDTAPNELAIFLTYDVILSEAESSGFFGGFHSYEGTPPNAKTWVYATYLDENSSGALDDVLALSHEVGEWADDPFTDNQTACGTAHKNLLEVGDPLVQPGYGQTGYGGYIVPLNGFSYHVQDLVFLPYFGAPITTSIAGQITFENEVLTVCQNGQ